MRRTRPNAGARGVTLLELVVALVITGIVVAGVAYFAYPVRQAVDVAVRADLTDIADNALQRLGREARLALPNSVRVDASGQYVEFLAVRAAGRYRADSGSVSGGTDCDNDDPGLPSGAPQDQLSFEVAEQCFKTIGKLAAAPQVGDFLVLNNHGPGFDGQNAYATSGTLNRAQIVTVDTGESGRERIRFAPTTFQRSLHDSPGRRFYAVSGPVSYGCGSGQMRRYAGYAISAAQPAPPSGGSSALIAEHVESCAFDYSPGVAPQIGLLTLRLTLAKPRSDGTLERVSLYHAVHVSNVP